MSPQSPPWDVVISNSGIKVTKNYKFVIPGHSSDSFSELRIEMSDIFAGGIKVGGIDTDMGGISTIAERKLQYHNLVRHTLRKLRFNCKANPWLSLCFTRFTPLEEGISHRILTHRTFGWMVALFYVLQSSNVPAGYVYMEFLRIIFFIVVTCFSFHWFIYKCSFTTMSNIHQLW